MQIRVVQLLGVVSCVFWLALPGRGDDPSPGAAKVDPLRVLVVTGGHAFDKSFFGLFEGNDDIVYKHVAHPDAFSELAPERVAQHDVVVLYDLYQGKPTPASARESFLELLEKGKGLVVLHHALASYGDWPEFQRIIGGKYLLRSEKTASGESIPKSTFRHGVKLRVEIADPAHPIAQGIDDFDLHDETYGRFAVDKDVDQILRTDHAASGRVIGWSKRYRNSRVVFLQPGHGPQAFVDKNYRRLVAQSIRWSARRLPARGKSESRAPQGPWRKLFNGKDITGWKAIGEAQWKVDEGILVGTQGAGAVGGELLSTEEFSDFDLRVTYRIRWPANSGVWFRYQSPKQAYQADILEWKNPRCWSGSIYCPGKMFISMNTDASSVRRDGWNTMLVRARGSRMSVDLNGLRVAEAVDHLSARGRVGFQVHAGASFPGMSIELLDVRVAPVSP